MAAKKKPIEEIDAGRARRRRRRRSRVMTLEAPPARKAGIKVGSVEELVAKLHNEAKVI